MSGTWNDLVPSDSKYLKKEDVGEAGYNLTIAKFVRENVGQGDDAEERAVVYFKGAKKGMVLNKTNAERLKYIFKTDDPDEVIGETVNVYSDPMIEFGGKLVGGLRIRKVQAKAPEQLEGDQQPTPPAEAYAGDPDTSGAEFDDDIPF